MRKPSSAISDRDEQTSDDITDEQTIKEKNANSVKQINVVTEKKYHYRKDIVFASHTFGLQHYDRVGW